MKNRTLFERENRNSQKRIYDPEGVYFITAVTKNRFPFFENEIFCELFVENLRICKQLKSFELYAWVIMHDHIHLLIKPGTKYNYSKVMQFLKRNISRNINFIMNENPHDELSTREGANDHSRLRLPGQKDLLNKFIDKKMVLKSQFLQKPKHETIAVPRFEWQKSFHDHLIRDEKDLEHHFEYIMQNPIDAEYPKNWPYIFTSPRFKLLSDTL
ncbi:transposase [Candidatus Peregrinibacteria bacterium]|nr:MAG: transposase [Candidatus Peregrinibacteria bacterium]